MRGLGRCIPIFLVVQMRVSTHIFEMVRVHTVESSAALQANAYADRQGQGILHCLRGLVVVLMLLLCGNRTSGRWN